MKHQMKHPAIKAVFFDYGNVCATFSFERFLNAFESHTGVPRNHTEELLFGGVMDGKSYGTLFSRLDRGEICPTDFFHQLTTTLHCVGKIDYATFAKLWAGVFIAENHRLAQLLYRVTAPKFILSNTNKILYAHYMAESEIMRLHFPLQKNRILSCREGMLKPEREIYDRAVEIARVRFNEALFIDDRFENIEAWETLGGYGIAYNAATDDISVLQNGLQSFGMLS